MEGNTWNLEYGTWSLNPEIWILQWKKYSVLFIYLFIYCKADQIRNKKSFGPKQEQNEDGTECENQSIYKQIKYI